MFYTRKDDANKIITDSAMDEYNTEQYVLKVRDLPIEDKPREKLIAHGPDALTNGELLAVIFGVGTRKEEVLNMASRVLREYGEKAIADQTNPQKVSDALDIPISKASQIVASFELGRRFYSERNGKPKTLRTPKEVWEITTDMHNLHKEQMLGLYLNSRYVLVHSEVVAIGTVDASIVHPREVFRPALEHSASAVILVHNHPSGDTRPSKADIEITKQLKNAGKLMGIELLDHVVVSKDGYESVG